jgi:hypothetical protein
MCFDLNWLGQCGSQVGHFEHFWTISSDFWSKMADLQATLRAQYPTNSGKTTYGYSRLCKYFQPVFTIFPYMINPQSRFSRPHHFILF